VTKGLNPSKRKIKNTKKSKTKVPCEGIYWHGLGFRWHWSFICRSEKDISSKRKMPGVATYWHCDKRASSVEETAGCGPEMESSAPVLCVCILYFIFFIFYFWSRNGILCSRPVCLYFLFLFFIFILVQKWNPLRPSCVFVWVWVFECTCVFVRVYPCAHTYIHIHHTHK
jgi:hypothetical protein